MDHEGLHVHHQLHPLPTLARPPLRAVPSSLHPGWLSILQLCVRASQLVLLKAWQQSRDVLPHDHCTMASVGFGMGTGIPAVIGSRVPTGTGTVLVFGTLRHTVYPYHGVTGISRVYYNINIIILTLFSHI